MRWRERWTLELVGQPELLLEQERTVEGAVGLLYFGEQLELLGFLFGGRLQQRPAGALDPSSLGCVGALVSVPLITADLVDGTLGEAHDVEGVERDLGLRDALADRLLLAAGHVDRDCTDRALALAEKVEELFECLGVAAG